ncbi:MAG: PTS sugar transporter subunit IIA [Ignavibacteriales bacterium CG12_big_fil_rev_8_21_14_0_65_30_8]|nr:MAG: PTS sugar transporter subunit IIA [Ignavibacteriales bacterium CG12_big_fil_rev_8_21_14_0_65_30_8]
MKVSEILKTENIIPSLKATTKKDAINELIDLFKNDERVINLEEIRNSIFSREEIMSTGVGKGFAIPHGKTNATTEVLSAFGIARTPIDFQSLDGNPVQLIFLLIGRDNMVSMHIKLLSRISRLMNEDEFRKKLLNTETSEELYKIFKEEEEKLILV